MIGVSSYIPIWSALVKFKVLPLSAAMLLSLHPHGVLAQSGNSVEEVTVTGKYSVGQTKALDTATGLGLTIAETPQSVSVLTFERMQDQNITSVLEAVNNAVGITAQETDNVRNDFYSRGFKIDSYQIDGVPTSWTLGGDSGETVADTVIYERIEFVRGATGLMTGVGDPSASINLVRKHANSKELTGYLDVGTGSWNKRTFAADVGAGLNESGTVRARLVGRYQGGESFVDSLEDDKSTLYGVMEADLTDSTLLRVGASYQHNDPKGATWGVLPAFFSDGTRPDWDVSKTTAMDWTRWESTNTNYFASVSHSFTNGWELLANYNHLSYESDTRLLYVAAPWNPTTRSYNYLNKDGSGLTAQRYRSDGKSEQDSFDIQLKGDFNLFNQTHDFVAGALYSDQSAKTFTQLPLNADLSSGYDQIPVTNFYEWANVPEPAWSTVRTQSQGSDTEQQGYYAATRLSVTDSFKFILGGRLATWERTGFDWSGIVDYGDKNEFIPYAGALYDLTDAHRIYASYTEIFKPQNYRIANGSFIDPLVGESAEIGLKSRFLDDRLQTTVAYFDIQQDNLAQTDTSFVPTNPDQTSAYIGAEGANSKGFEIEVVGQPIDGWNISAGYTQFSIEDANGNDLNTDIATKTIKLFTSYEFGGALQNLMLGGGVNWQNETYSEGLDPLDQLGRLTQDAYALVSLMARYSITEDLSVQLNAANVTDEKYYSQIGQFNIYRYGTPRNYTLSLNYKF